MELNTILERLAERHGIVELNEMQQMMAGTDARKIILLAPTGSGKTAAFAIRLLRHIGAPQGKVQAVVIAPSRELVLQIAEVIRPVAAGLKTVAFYGGHAMEEEVKSLSVVPDIVVATPGRLLDHLTRGTLNIGEATALVLDEYDKSLELGFHDEMKRIARRLNRPELVILTSATRLAELPEFLPLEGVETVDYSRSGASGRLQTVRVESTERDKLGVLTDLLRSLPQGRAIVFVNHRESAERVYDTLRREQMPVGLYHGGLEQRERQLAIDLFNNGTTPILVSTDLGARGLDVEDVNYVIHYHLPLTPESWTHRNGRTARMGREGTAFSIIATEENVPEFVTWSRDYSPRQIAENGIAALTATLYFNAGKKEKISRGDIAGFLMQKGGLTPGEVGKISLSDHSAIVAIPAGKAHEVLAAIEGEKVKGKSVRISLLTPTKPHPKISTAKPSTRNSAAKKPSESSHSRPGSARKRATEKISTAGKDQKGRSENFRRPRRK